MLKQVQHDKSGQKSISFVTLNLFQGLIVNLRLSPISFANSVVDLSDMNAPEDLKNILNINSGFRIQDLITRMRNRGALT